MEITHESTKESGNRRTYLTIQLTIKRLLSACLVPILYFRICTYQQKSIKIRFFFIFIATRVSFSSSVYISGESNYQVTVSVMSSAVSSTDFVIELHANPITASGNSGYM